MQHIVAKAEKCRYISKHVVNMRCNGCENPTGFYNIQAWALVACAKIIHILWKRIRMAEMLGAIQFTNQTDAEHAHGGNRFGE